MGVMHWGIDTKEQGNRKTSKWKTAAQKEGHTGPLPPLSLASLEEFGQPEFYLQQN